MLQIRFLGQFDVRVDGQRIVIPSRAGQSLFAYLVLTAGTMHRREKLAGLFWPDTSDEQARHSLRSELWRVRKAIQRQPAQDEDYLITDEYSLGFNLHADYRLDAALLQAPADDLDSLSSALSLYQGELLPGMYDDWVLLERDRLHSVFETKMQDLLARLIQEARWQMVLEWSEKWIALGQTPEAAYRALILAYAVTGNRTQVAATFERCRKDLDKELGVEPSDETRALYDQIMRGEAVAHVDLYAQPILPTRLAHVEEPPAPGEPPFKGLEFFDEHDAALYFGREALTAKLAQRLQTSRFLAVVVGASGSGKSSLVRAGLIPKLRSENRDARIVVLTPTAHPLEAFAMALTHAHESVTATATLMDDMMQDARALHLFLRRQTTGDRPQKSTTRPSSLSTRHLVVVDQFEEMFTLCRDELEREQFIDNLLYALSQSSLLLVLALRADFYAHLAHYAELRELAVQHQEYIGPMTTDELRRAIEEPAKQQCAENGAPWEFEPGLVDLLLRDVGDEPGALPLLSHALLETWRRRSGHTMTLKGYHDAGGVRGAIAQTADTAYQQLDAEQQHIARNIFLRLTELGEGTEDTRRRATFQELIPQGENGAVVRAVLTQLADSRLITLGENTVEVAHEALIREWGRLREWLNQDRDGLKLHRSLTDAAREWDLLERDEGTLYRGARLAQAVEWWNTSRIESSDPLNELERAFLNTSLQLEERQVKEKEAQRQRELVAAQTLAEEKEERLKAQANANQRLRRRAIFLAGVGALALVLAAFVIFFAKSSGDNAIAAQHAQAVAQDRLLISEKQRLVAEGTVALEDKNSADVAALLALHVLKDGYDEPADRLLLHSLEHDYPRTIFNHDQPVPAVDISPDGKYVVTGSDDKRARLWDARSGREIREFAGHTTPVFGTKFSPDGKSLVTSGDNLRIWDVESGKEITAFASNLFNGFGGIAISPDGASIASGDGNSALLRVWNTGGTMQHWLQGHSQPATAVQFSNDGAQLFSVGLDGIGILWDLKTDNEIRRFVPGGGQLWSAAVSPDGQFVAAAGEAKTIWLWSVETGALVREFVGHQAGVDQLAFLPDGKFLVSASDDGSVRLWDVQTGETLHQFLGHRGRVLSLAVSRDGKTLVTAGTDGKALRWEIFPEREPLVLNQEDFNDAALSPDGKTLAVSANQVLTLYNPTNGAVIRNLATLSDYPVDTLRFSPDGKFLFGRFDFPGGRRRGFLWDAQSGELLNEFRDPLMRGSAAFSPDGKSILTASEGGANLWTLDRATPVQRFEGHPGSVGGVAFSPDGKLVATTSYQDKSASLWDLYTGKEIRTFVGHTAEVEGVDFSPDGKQLVTASRDGTVRVWDIGTGKELRQFLGHTAAVSAVKFSPDGKFLLSGGDDRTARLWEVVTGNQVREFTTQGKVKSLEFFPDGKRVMVVSDDGVVRIWRLDLNEVMQMACARLPRDLDAAEIQEYNIRNYVPVCPKK